MITGVRRSLIYVPGDSERMLRRAADLPADVLLLNLEDGVSESLKEAARANVCRTLHEVRLGDREIVVRVNPPSGSTGQEDLAAVVPLRPDGICLPKAEHAGSVQALDERLRELEERAGVEPGTMRIHAMIESPGGVLRAARIAGASPRMASLIFGSADYAAECGCSPGGDRSEILLALQMIVLAARAAGIDSIDAPCFDLQDTALLRRESSQARRLGFSGKSALHPAQLDVINREFAVTPEEVAWSRRVLAELHEAESRGKALSTLDGRLIDNPHRKAAEAILRRARLAR